MIIGLSKPIARSGKVDEFDVRRIKKALTGYGLWQGWWLG